ncbi:phosphatidylserine decarboxylase family protein [uncultured Desulfovibrio sp.]|uniref:phosphatidylserine decarboxylase family protein n=1 Tax=uncultured Desulfovibrio sp. TaxID=167968 RepID=UPI0026211EB2|nr:phosphatidylserine decarboxylase family protein [uncultured Desulfovibrio sp.]
MRPASCGITPEGWPCIGITAVTALVFACLHWPVPAILALALCWFAVHFFRDPERVVPGAPGLAVSPADGRVIRIERKPDPLTGDERTCISIFMNVFSVHVNRSPVTGVVERIRYWPGKFVNAAYDKAATGNERCGYLLRGEDGAAWTMVQIAGLIARRIVCRVTEGDTLERGQRYGMIRFGSRVDLYLPEGYVPSVTIGEQVFAGQSTLAARTESDA